MVGGTGIEPVTPSVSGKCSTAELTTHSLLVTVFRQPGLFKPSHRIGSVPLIDGFNHIFDCCKHLFHRSYKFGFAAIGFFLPSLAIEARKRHQVGPGLNVWSVV